MALNCSVKGACFLYCMSHSHCVQERLKEETKSIGAGHPQGFMRNRMRKQNGLLQQGNAPVIFKVEGKICA